MMMMMMMMRKERGFGIRDSCHLIWCFGMWFRKLWFRVCNIRFDDLLCYSKYTMNKHKGSSFKTLGFFMLCRSCYQNEHGYTQRKKFMRLMILERVVFYGMRSFAIFYKIGSGVSLEISTWCMPTSPLHAINSL